MDYYCVICDRSINYKNRNKHNKNKKTLLFEKFCDKYL